MVKFGNTIKKLRKARNLTLTDIARQSDLPLSVCRVDV